MHVDVVVLGWSTDGHVSSVLTHLQASGVSSICIDQIALWQETVTFQPAVLRLKVGGQEISSCSLVWNRRAYPTTIRYMSKGEKEFARAEFAHTLFGSLRALCSSWFNSPEAVSHATYKAAQLHWAARDGRLRVPRTLITSNSSEAKAFVGRNDGCYVIKALYRAIIESDRAFHVMYTSPVDARVRKRWADLKHSPCIIQEFIERQFDVRLNVIGDAVFATRLDTSHIAEAAVDGRRVRDHRDIRHSAIEAPDAIGRACRDMCAYFGLRFGAFDFVVGKDDVWYFLEVNPNGQWYWIEEMTGQPLSTAMADEILRQIGRAPGKNTAPARRTRHPVA